MRLLVVEDEAVLARNVADGLRDAGFAVDIAPDGTDALDKLAVTTYDVVVLDRDLPGVPGDEVCRTLVGSRPRSRILMLTAAAEVDDRISGLGLGADDYLGKPFAFAELVARVRALSRRPPSVAPVVSREDLEVDLGRRMVRRAGEPVLLTRKEFGVLEALVLADGSVVSTEELLDQVWDENLDPFSNVVAVTLGRLRRKLGSPPLIETVVGTGYRL
ncbi:response regulator transcription factor [Kribbella sp.]|uniref:response regulator transcription factor n=1 Tax=Kribbella sp. TaxID=1871183 RepID=UPI002D404029|nr:response regulator transcription factor [Kribbella sp.]HZX08368.1 response regulator transcription factor [Kribbella sp.]